MNGTTLLEDLEWAERYVTEGLIHIRRKNMLIAALIGTGKDTGLARSILEVLETAQRDHVAARNRLEVELSSAQMPPAEPDRGT